MIEMLPDLSIKSTHEHKIWKIFFETARESVLAQLKAVRRCLNLNPCKATNKAQIRR